MDKLNNTYIKIENNLYYDVPRNICNNHLYAIYDCKCGKSFKKFNEMNKE